MPEDYIEYESFTVISIDSLLVYYNKYYPQVYLDNYTYNILNKQMTDYLNKNILKIRYYKWCITISKGIDLSKSNNSKECMICHYRFFNHGFEFHNHICYGCHDLISS